MEAALYPDLLEQLQRNNALLEQIMKCLESYLEVKRVAFPRFYFLSNDELLEILAQVINNLYPKENNTIIFDFRLEILTQSSRIYANVSMQLQNWNLA